MASPIVTLFNPWGRSGKTFLTYHLAWMFAEMGVRVLIADLDPNANLTAAFLDEDAIAQLWSSREKGICGALQAWTEQDAAPPPRLEEIAEGIALLPGDVALLPWEERLAQAWAVSADGSGSGVRSGLSRLLQSASSVHSSDLVLLDLDSNLGAINHTAVCAADFLAVPLGPDLFSFEGLLQLGPKLQEWRPQETDRPGKTPCDEARMEPAGYIALAPAGRLHRPARGHTPWAILLPQAYRTAVLGRSGEGPGMTEDPDCLGLLPLFESLLPLAREAKKPIFHLKPADGADGSLLTAAQNAHKLFKQLARQLARRTGIEIRV